MKKHNNHEFQSIKKQIYDQIDINFLKKTTYNPLSRRFEITFYDEPIYIN